MCIRDSIRGGLAWLKERLAADSSGDATAVFFYSGHGAYNPVSYTHLRAHETVLDIVCRLLLEKKKRINPICYGHATV